MKKRKPKTKGDEDYDLEDIKIKPEPTNADKLLTESNIGEILNVFGNDNDEIETSDKKISNEPSLNVNDCKEAMQFTSSDGNTLLISSSTLSFPELGKNFTRAWMNLTGKSVGYGSISKNKQNDKWRSYLG